MEDTPDVLTSEPEGSLLLGSLAKVSPTWADAARSPSKGDNDDLSEVNNLLRREVSARDCSRVLPKQASSWSRRTGVRVGYGLVSVTLLALLAFAINARAGRRAPRAGSHTAVTELVAPDDSGLPDAILCSGRGAAVNANAGEDMIPIAGADVVKQQHFTLTARIRASYNGASNLILAWDAGQSPGIVFRLSPSGNLEYGEFTDAFYSVSAHPPVNLTDRQAIFQVAVVRKRYGRVELFVNGDLVGLGAIPPYGPQGLSAHGKTSASMPYLDFCAYAAPLTANQVQTASRRTLTSTTTIVTTSFTTRTTTFKLDGIANQIERASKRTLTAAVTTVTTTSQATVPAEAAGTDTDVAKTLKTYIVLIPCILARASPGTDAAVVGWLYQGAQVDGWMTEDGRWLLLDKQSALLLEGSIGHTEAKRRPYVPAQEGTLLEVDRPPRREAQVTQEAMDGDLRENVHNQKGPGSALSCTPPRVPIMNRTCVCSPPLVLGTEDDCVLPREPQPITFYVYHPLTTMEAQYDSEFFHSLGNLGGVLFYLHLLVVTSCPRKHNISFIGRFEVTVQAPKKVWDLMHAFDFAPFISPGECACMQKDCPKHYGDHGYAPTCRQVSRGDSRSSMAPYVNGVWFSLPEKCPAEEVTAGDCPFLHDMETCSSQKGCGHSYSGCTWKLRPAGVISLDELSGIDNYEQFCKDGNSEFQPGSDSGVGTHFWDGQRSVENCSRREQAVKNLFAHKYPNLPSYLPEPACGQEAQGANNKAMG